MNSLHHSVSQTSPQSEPPAAMPMTLATPPSGSLSRTPTRLRQPPLREPIYPATLPTHVERRARSQSRPGSATASSRGRSVGRGELILADRMTTPQTALSDRSHPGSSYGAMTTPTADATRRSVSRGRRGAAATMTTPGSADTPQRTSAHGASATTPTPRSTMTTPGKPSLMTTPTSTSLPRRAGSSSAPRAAPHSAPATSKAPSARPGWNADVASAYVSPPSLRSGAVRVPVAASKRVDTNLAQARQALRAERQRAAAAAEPEAAEVVRGVTMLSPSSRALASRPVSSRTARPLAQPSMLYDAASPTRRSPRPRTRSMARSLSRPASQPTALGFEDAIDAMDHPDGRDQAQPPFDGGDNDDAASQTRLTRQLMLSMQRERDDREQMTQEMDALRAELEATRMDMALLLENRDNLAAELQALQHVHRQALSSTMATPRADRVAASPSAYASEFGIDRHTPADDGDLYADVVADVDDDAAAHDAMRARLRREAAAFEVEMRQFEARRHASAEAQHREPQRDPRRGRAERSGPVHHDVASPFGEAANYTALDRPAARSMGSGTRRTRASSPSPSSHDDATPPMVPAPTSTFTSEFASAGVMATPSNKILRGLPDPFDTPVSRMADRLAVWSIAPPAA